MPYHAGSPDLGTAGDGDAALAVRHAPASRRCHGPFRNLGEPPSSPRIRRWRHPRDCADDMTAWETEVLVAVAQGLTSGPGIRMSMRTTLVPSLRIRSKSRSMRMRAPSHQSPSLAATAVVYLLASRSTKQRGIPGNRSGSVLPHDHIIRPRLDERRPVPPLPHRARIFQ